MSLSEKLAELGVEITPEFTGEFIRSGSQWFKGVQVTTPSGVMSLAYFGDYRTGKQAEWQSEPNETPEIKAAIEKAKDSAKEEREAYQKELAPQLAREFEGFAPRGSTPYLTKKQVSDLFKARIKDNPNGDPIVCVPLADATGQIWNYQRIYSQKLSAGDKFFCEGARIDGLFHLLVENQNGPLYICEGFATAASVALALAEHPCTVACAFNAGNLEPASRALRAAYPTRKFIICADNDAYTEINGRPVNVGVTKARKSAGVIQAEVRVPQFKRPQKGLTDFNDLHCAEGLDAVRDQLLNPGKYTSELQPLGTYSVKGKLILPSEIKVAEHLIEHFKGKFAKEDRSLFQYTGTHWRELKDDDTDKLKLTISSVAGGELTSNQQDSYYRTFFRAVDCPPRGISLWAPRPNAANFRNGTLHYYTVPGEKGKLKFQPHHASDYLRNTLPFDYPTVPLEQIPSPEFDKALERLWLNDPEKDLIKRLVKQMMGACLIPDFRRVFLFLGPKASGKSTIILLMKNLLSPDSFCSVEPSEMHGFEMEPMLGKLVNLVTEVSGTKAMDVANVKKLIDGTLTIKRKFKTTIDCRPPAVHIFAGNNMLIADDFGAAAFDRRLIVIPTGSFKAPEDHQQDFVQWLVAKESPGIVARALEGLIDLISLDGHFVVPQSSKERVSEMHMERDIVAQFFDDVRKGEIKTEKGPTVLMGENCEIETSQLWSIFDRWQRENVRENKLLMGKIGFNTAVIRRSFAVRRKTGPKKSLEGWRGIGHCVDADEVG